MAVAGLSAHFSIVKPAFNAYTWETDYWESVDIIDAALNAATGLTNIKGIWANSTAYAAGDRAIDNTTGVVYEVAAGQGHTSAAADTFAADRAANPAYWTSWNANGIAADIVFTPAGGIAAINVQTAIEELDTEKATLAAPAFTGNPTAATQTVENNSTRLATTAFVQTQIDADIAVLSLGATYQPLDATLTAWAGVTFAANKLGYATGADAFSTTDLTAFALTILDDATAGAVRTTIEATHANIVNEATVANLRQGAANVAITPAIIESALEFVAITPNATLDWDWSAAFNFSLAMGGNYIVQLPTNPEPGTWREIRVTQDGTGSRTLAWATAGVDFTFAGGGTPPTLSTVASSVDTLYIKCTDTTTFEVHSSLNWVASS